jgi:PAS domain S-box-containing protein
MSHAEPGAPLASPAKGTVEAQLQEIQRIAQLGSWEIDFRTRELTWSAEMFRIYGLRARHPGPEPSDCLATVHPDDVQATDQAYAHAVAHGTALDFVHRVRVAGDIKHVRVRGEVQYAPEGSPVRSVGTAQDITGIVAQAQSLQASQARLQSIFEAMSEGMVFQGADGAITEANTAAERILGLTRDEILGRTSTDPRWRTIREDGSPFAGEDHPSMVALRTGMPQRDQVMGVLDPRRGLRWLRVNANPMVNAGDTVAHAVVATFEDITERKNLEAQLLAAATDAQDLYDNAPCGYHSLDAEGKFVKVNATELAWLGCTRDEVIGKKGPIDFYSPESQALFRQSYPRFKQTGRSDGLEIDLVPKQGPMRRCLVSATAVLGPDGSFIKSRSVMYDISELHRAREQLRELTLQQDAMLNGDMIGMARSRHHRIVWANRGMSRMFGYEPHEFAGMNARLLYPSDQAFEAAAALIKDAKDGLLTRVQLELVRKSGEPIWVDVSSVFVSAPLHESFTAMVDITSQRQAQALKLEALQLEAQSQQRRIELLEEHKRRLQSERHAQDLNRLLTERSEMLNVLAHEVRQPLNNASAALQSAASVLSGLDEGAASARLARAEGVMAQVMGSIDNTLAVASLLALPGPVHREDADIDMLLALVIAELPDEQRERVKVARATETRTAAMDISLMRLAVRNLLNNALVHSAPGTPVTIRLSDSDEPLALVIEVIDQGSGIPDELLPHVFERRLSATPPRKAQGLGLGLYIVRRVMTLHGGSVSLCRNTPQGVTMRLLVNQGLSD